MVDIIIFSKDRACQLQALLRSLEEKLKIEYTVTVLYTETSDLFKSAYEKLFLRDFKNTSYILESDFESDLKNILFLRKTKFMMFLVDDIIIKDVVEYDDVFKKFEEDKSIMSLSLRLGKNINYCYNKNKYCSIPKFIDDKYNIWKWREEPAGDWSYPMSVDGNIFRREEIVPCINGLSFKNPNQMESKMAHNPLDHVHLLCYDNSKLLNTPINIVQAGRKNRHGNISSEFLNGNFLNGYQIKLESIYKENNNSCHYEMEIEFEQQRSGYA